MRVGRSLGDTVQNPKAFVQTYATRDALAAGFRVGELDKVAGNVDHAVVFVHHDHAPGTHDGAELCEVLVVDRRVEHVVRDASAGRAARLNRFDLTVADRAF